MMIKERVSVRGIMIELSLAAAVLVSVACGCSGSGQKGVAVSPVSSGADDGGQAEPAEAQQPSPSDSKEEKTRESLEQLFSLCASGDFEKAAGYIVYRGSDESREWKDTCTYSNEEEKEQVNSVCARINEYMAGGSRYSFGGFSTEEEPEGEWLALEVSFTSPGKQEKAIFAFLEIGGRCALGDID